MESSKLPLDGWTLAETGDLRRSENPSLRYAVSEPLREYLGLFLGGQSIQGAAQSFFEKGRKFSFIKTSDALRFLIEANVLTDPAWVRWFGRIRSRWLWPRGVLQTVLWQRPVGVLPYRPPAAQHPWYLLALVGSLMAAGFSGLGAVVSVSRADLDGFSLLLWSAVFLPALFAVNSVLRLAIEALAQRFAATSQKDVMAELLPLGPRLRTERAHLRRLSAEHFALEGVLLFTPLISLGVLSWIAAPGAWVPVAVYSAVLLLEELSPFKESRLTDWLNAYYDRRLRQMPSSQARKETLEQLVWVRGILDLLWIVAVVYVTVILLPKAWPLTVLFAGFWIHDIAKGANASLPLTGNWRRAREKSARAGVEKDTVRQLPFFAALDQDFFDSMMSEAKVIRRKKGAAVCRHGERGRDLFVLLDGQASVYRRYPDGKSRWITGLKPFSIFGEGGYFLDQPRSADVVCETDCTLLRIGFSELFSEKKLVGDRAQVLRLRIWALQAMSVSPVFRDLPSEIADAILFSGRIMQLPKTRILFNEGDPGDGCYLVVQGAMEVRQNDKAINRLGKGDLFGEITLLDPGLKRTSSVVATDETILVHFPSDRFFTLLAQNLPLGLAVERIAESRLRQDRARKDQETKRSAGPSSSGR